MTQVETTQERTLPILLLLQIQPR
ncbi:uncharacterized protein METZ01_LOCUS132822 [marine metagenome]|uniref:Uncharacterized protein n=1 Tax=marine metagenome TaxID=408172 RepID=A0A381YSF0_9ZZZZ